MLSLKKPFKNIDLWGSTTSLLCAIHCAALPLLLSSGFIGAHTYLSHPLVEFSVLSLTAIFVYFSIIKPFLQSRENLFPFTIATVGLFMVLVHHFLSDYSTLTVVIGGILIALGHIIKMIGYKHGH